MKPLKTTVNTNPAQSMRLSVLKFVPFWPLFLVLLLVSLLAAWLYLQYSTPLYKASAHVLIKDDRKGAESVKAFDKMDVLESKKIVENEMDVIQSRPLLYTVIKKMHLYAPVYTKTTFRNELQYAQAPVIIEASAPEALDDYGEIEFAYDKVKRTVTIEQKAYPLDSWQQTPFGQLKFSSNRKYRPTADNSDDQYIFFLLKLKSIAARLETRLTAGATSKLSSMIEISYKDADRDRAEDILNELIVAYMNAGNTDKDNLAANTLAFIDNRLKIVEKELSDIEQKKQRFVASKSAFDISTRGRLFLENVSSNDQKISEINMKLSVLNEVDNYVSSKDNSGGVVPSSMGITDPLLSQLVEKLYNTELEYESLKKTTAVNNPMLVSVNDRIEKIKPNIKEVINNERRSLEAGRNNINATNGAYSSVLSSMPQTERELVDIDRQQNIKSGIYTYLLQKKEETALSQQTIIPDSKVVSDADAGDSPVSPNGKMIYSAAVIFSILLGIGIIMGKETLSNKVMFRHEIENATKFPVIGEISIEASPDPIVISDDKKTFIAEQFRRLRITLDFLDINKNHKKILVTSAISGEGKSFIASNLALTLALTGKKVVLLDFDLNNPSLNNKLNIGQNKGITDYLLNESTLEEIIFPTDLDPNLFLISTGRLPHNPTELLLNDNTEILLKQVEDRFDYIVIDTAPVIPVTDAYILSRYCDATLYVIRHGYTPKIFLEKIDENNKMNQLHNVGIVFNSISSRGLGNNNYGYGYGYGYSFENSRKGRRSRSSAN